MIRLLSFAVCLVVGVTPLAAQDEVLSLKNAYQQYNAAIRSGDAEAARTYARLAYEAGQRDLGQDDMQVGFLAANYGEILVAARKFKTALEAFEDCTRILSAHRPEKSVDLAYCHFMTGRVEEAQDHQRKAERAYEAVVALGAEVQGAALGRKILGDAYLSLASLAAPETAMLRERGERYGVEYKRTFEFTQAAMPYLRETYGDRSEQVATALVLQGYFQEAEREFEEAEALYTEAADILTEVKGEDDSFAVMASARASWARFEIARRDSQLPQWEAENENVPCEEREWAPEDIRTCPVRRVHPEFPQEAFKSNISGGYCIVSFDVTEKGRTENVEIADCWPERYFAEPSVRAVKDWRYTPAVDSEGNPAVRRGVTITLRYTIHE